MIERKTSIPKEVIESLRKAALDTGLFVPIGKGLDISCRTDRELEEPQVDVVIEWLESVVRTIRAHEEAGSETG